jgi:hypothetical protein
MGLGGMPVAFSTALWSTLGVAFGSALSLLLPLHAVSVVSSRAAAMVAVVVRVRMVPPRTRVVRAHHALREGWVKEQ